MTTTTTAKRHLTATGWKPCTDTTGRCPYGVHEDASKPLPSVEETREILQAEIAKEQEKRQLRAREELLGLSPDEERRKARQRYERQEEANEQQARLQRMTDASREKGEWIRGAQDRADAAVAARAAGDTEEQKPASNLIPVTSENIDEVVRNAHREWTDIKRPRKSLDAEQKAKLKKERSADWWDHGFKAPFAKRSAPGFPEPDPQLKQLTEEETAVVASYAEHHTTDNPERLDEILQRNTGEKILYKGIQNFQMEANSVEELRAAVEARFPLGGTVDFEDFTTTTTVPETALLTSTGVADERRLPFKEGVFLELKTSKGIAVSQLAGLRSRDQEALLPRNTKWRVVAVHPGTMLKAESTYRDVHRMEGPLKGQSYEYHGSNSRPTTVIQLVEVDEAAEAAKRAEARERREYDRAREQQLQRVEDRFSGRNFR